MRARHAIVRDVVFVQGTITEYDTRVIPDLIQHPSKWDIGQVAGGVIRIRHIATANIYIPTK
jgi:hypothetical protein